MKIYILNKIIKDYVGTYTQYTIYRYYYTALYIFTLCKEHAMMSSRDMHCNNNIKLQAEMFWLFPYDFNIYLNVFCTDY